MGAGSSDCVNLHSLSSSCAPVSRSDVEDKDLSALQDVYNYGSDISGLEVVFQKFLRRKKIVCAGPNMADQAR